MRLPLALLLIAALLSWASMQLGRISLVAPPTTGAAASSASPPSEAARDLISAAAASETPPPPLFRPASAPDQTATAPGEHFTLVGLAGRGETRVAYVRDDADQRTSSLRVGEALGAWRLAETNDRCVVLRRGQQRRELCLS